MRTGKIIGVRVFVKEQWETWWVYVSTRNRLIFEVFLHFFENQLRPCASEGTAESIHICFTARSVDMRFKEMVLHPQHGILLCFRTCSSALRCVAECYSVLQCVAVYCSVLQCIAWCCNALFCLRTCRSVLQCVAVCCSVLQCIAVYNSLLQGVVTHRRGK